MTNSIRHLFQFFIFALISLWVAFQWRSPMRILFTSESDSRVVGFYSVQREGERTFRWTTEKAIVKFPDIGKSTPLLVSINANAVRHDDLVYTATVLVNGYPVGEITKAGWRNWRFMISDSSKLYANELEIKIDAVSFVPQELFEESEDERRLGIALESIEIVPQWTALSALNTLPDLFTVPSASPFVFAICLAFGLYVIFRFVGVSAELALACGMGGILFFAIGLALARVEPSLRFPMFAVGVGSVAASSILWKIFVPGSGRAQPSWHSRLKGALGFDREQSFENFFIVATGVFIAIALRLTLFRWENGDYLCCLGPWYSIIREKGFSAFQSGFSNYAPLYFYFVYFVSVAFPDLPSLFGIKLISVFFDFVCAIFVWKIVELKYGQRFISKFAFFAVIFLPTVFLNSSFWGQIESVYTTGVVACVYFILTKRENLALVALGLAFAIKPLAIFLAPLLLILLLKRVISWTSLFIPPIVYVLTMLPAWLAGRSLLELVMIYLPPANLYRVLSSYAPNMYQWIPEKFYDFFVPVGIIWSTAIVFLFVIAVYKSKATLDTSLIIAIATVSTLVLPYVLPKMNEHYFYPADILSIAFAFYFPRYGFLAIGVQLASLFSYFPVILGSEIVPLPILALGLLFVILVFGAHLASMLYGSDIWVTGKGNNVQS